MNKEVASRLRVIFTEQRVPHLARPQRYLGKPVSLKLRMLRRPLCPGRSSEDRGAMGIQFERSAWLHCLLRQGQAFLGGPGTHLLGENLDKMNSRASYKKNRSQLLVIQTSFCMNSVYLDEVCLIYSCCIPCFIWHMSLLSVHINVTLEAVQSR